MGRTTYVVNELLAAEADRDDIIEYLISEESLQTGLYVGRELVRRSATLNNFPQRHERIPLNPSDPREVRRMPVWSYIIIYRIDESAKRVVILGVFDARQSPGRLDSVLSRA